MADRQQKKARSRMVPRWNGLHNGDRSTSAIGYTTPADCRSVL